MKHSPDNAAEPSAPVWRTVEDARRDLEETIENFVASAADGEAKPRAVLALKVTAGTGKTGTTLRAPARHAGDLLSRGHVLVYLPTLDLTERAAEEFRETAPNVAMRGAPWSTSFAAR